MNYSQNSDLCWGCLSSGRRKALIKYDKQQFLYDVIGDNKIIPKHLNDMEYCWECTAMFAKLIKFKNRVRASYTAMKYCLAENLDVTALQKPSKLNIHRQFNISYDDNLLNQENSFCKLPKVEEQSFDDDPASTDHISDDNNYLTPLPEKKKPVKSKKKKRDCPTKKYKEIELSKEEIEKERQVLSGRETFVNAHFKCDFANADDFKDHNESKHNVVTAFKCDICQSYFNSVVSLTYYSHTHSRRYACSICAKRHNTKRMAEKHYDETHPTVSTVGALDSLRKVQALERPLHQHRRRELPAARTLPDGYVECGVKGQSAPRSDAEKRPANNDSTETAGTAPASKRCLIQSVVGASPSSSEVRAPLRDEEIGQNPNYGSEGDSDGDERDEDIFIQAVVPRADRMFMSGSDMEVPSTNVELCFEWPPQPPSDFQPEPSVQNEPRAQLEPNVQTEPSAQTDPSIIYMPKDKFDFEWRGFPESQIPPELRKEIFSNINCGPTVPLASPYEAFIAIWDRQIMEHIAVETNRYAQQVVTAMINEANLHPTSRITRWRDTDADELYVYFAILLATGIIVKSRTDSYWNTSQDLLSSPGFSASMSYDRYQLLSKCLHFSNNDDCNPNVMTRSEAKLFKLYPILHHLNQRFSQLYTLSQNVVLDESLTQWKEINQFIRNKAATVGIKTYEVCESRTGYLWRFEVHVGHDESPRDSPLSGVVPALVLRLLNGLEHKGYTIWMDNFYNSPALARELKVRGFDCVGTLRLNRQFVPMELANLTKRCLAVGQMRGCTSGDVDLLVWRDKNLVSLISTYHGLAAVKCGDVLKPSIVPDYNVCMGGVDLKDQMIAMYSIERGRNRVWYKKFFRRLLNASVLNAFILLRTQQPITHRSFRETLVRQLVAKHMPPSPVVAPPMVHFPAQYDFLAGKQHERQRRFCVVCKKRTTAYCRQCNVPLCVFTCFKPHHTRQ